MKHLHDGVISLSFRFLPRGHEAPIIEHHLPLCINTDCLLCSALPLPLLFIFSHVFDAHTYPFYVF